MSKEPGALQNWVAFKEAEVGWEREGDPVDVVLHSILQCDKRSSMR